MNLILRSRLIVAGCFVLAIWFGWRIANDSFGWPAFAAAGVLAAVLVRLLRVPVDTLTIGFVIFGYLVGNRGFAQLMPIPRMPLLPGEIALAIAGSILVVRSTFSQKLPFRRDVLNVAVLAWLVLGTARVVFDVPGYGLMAVRDYAMIYYAGFFFIAQQIASEERSRRFLLVALVAASIAQPLAATLAEYFPNFFYNRLVIAGTPLIYFKGDLAATFMAASSIVLFFAARGPHRYWVWPVSAVMFAYVVGGENRASMFGALAALAWLGISRTRAFFVVQTSALALALLLVLGLAKIGENAWAESKIDAAVERVSSVVDVMGRGTYVTEESSMKGDNNRFRWIWWNTVARETIASNPVFGLGFGYDLARTFLQEYNPDMTDDFTVRSPHSIVVSAFGRLGTAGLAVFVLILVSLASKTWRAMRNPAPNPMTIALWSCSWVILVSACLGVVLEGPMGAVVFWTLLGIANAGETGSAPAPANPTAQGLQPAPAPAEMVASA